MKRRLILLALLSLLLAAVLAVPVSAESMASRVDFTGTVNIDGDCLVTMLVNLHLESAEEKLTFPLPANATNITVNGASPSVSRAGSYTAVSLTRATGGLAGDFTVQIAYTIPKTVTLVDSSTVSITDGRRLKLEIPILCGFSYPVQSLMYTITLPKEVTATPDFYSTYRQNGLASDLNVNINGTMITGSSKSGFNDHESMSMSMLVTPEMFPGVSTYQRTGNPELIPMGIFAGLALVYWLIFLRTFPARRESTALPPEGVTAGELACRLNLVGPDLTLMVLSWAQMGYILIQQEDGRVLLHKRMDMGNERSLFEVRTFRSLFGQRRVIDAAGAQYAKLLRRTAATLPGESALCKSSERNRKVYRYLLCVSHVFCGICVAMNMTAILPLQILFSLIFGILGAVTAWLMHKFAFCTHVRKKTGMYVAGGCVVLWVVLGILSGQVWIPLGASVVQILLGFPAAWGGRRTDLNRMESARIRGLRSYLKHISKQDVQRMLSVDPDYFFRMAPYAMALGVMKPFAAAFGKRKLEQCPYLVTRQHGRRKAEEWAELMEALVSRMDARARQMELEKWMAIRVR